MKYSSINVPIKLKPFMKNFPMKTYQIKFSRAIIIVYEKQNSHFH